MPDSHRYTAELANHIEPAWQSRWAELGIDRQPNPGEEGFDASKPRYYCLDMFPYPSGAGLHVGHPEGYTATDIICRYKRMKGFNVLHPMGWDAFGLPAEQYAIQTGVHPAETTRTAIDNFRRQLQRFGFCYDWSREFGTIDEDYYKWTQWIFLKLYDSWLDTDRGDHGAGRSIDELITEFESGDREIRFNPDAAEIPTHLKSQSYDDWSSLDAGVQRDIIDSYRLAYIGEQTVNWCPKLGTALANEEVIDGKSERGGFPVFRKPLRQWMLRITAYAERLLFDLDGLDWPESTLTQQREWIGRSEGAEIDFEIADPPMGVDSTLLRVFTTRPDTIFGATYMVVAPEHPLVDAVLADPRETTDAAALREYVEWARNRSDVERLEGKEKTGKPTGLEAINPATGQRIPIWTADYVLAGYGSGAIMAVPAHDQRDFEFAQEFELPIRDVVYPVQVAAMAHFAAHAPDDTVAGDWRNALADLLGLVTARGSTPADFDSLLAVATSRRRASGNAPDGKAERRGAISGEWLDTVRSLEVETFDEFAELFRDAAYYEAEGGAFSGTGRLVNSSNTQVSLNGLTIPEAKGATLKWLEHSGVGRRKINHKLRDWLFSRQRYWGEPFPIVYDDQGRHHPVAESALPITLPPMTDYKPEVSDEPKPLLAKATDWIRTTAADAHAVGLDPDAKVTRESNTMPGWAGSCWYHLRYTDPANNAAFAGPDAESYWLGEGPNREPGVDLYVGGAEHAVLHLLYARFWHKVLYDLGYVSSNEPYRKLYHQGLILSHAYQRADKSLVPVDEVEERGENNPVETATGEPVTQIIAKMSKSLRNVVNPDDVIAEYGADTFRLYEMYMGPLDQQKPWDTRAIGGMFRFLKETWRLVIDEDTGAPRTTDTADESLKKLLHRTTEKVGGDIERLAFNTAIAAMIEFKNAAQAIEKQAAEKQAGTAALTADQIDRLMRLLAPFAPHLAEEVWHRLGLFDARGPVHTQAWPTFDPAMLADDEIEIPVQIMGKVRGRITIPADADTKTMEQLALADDRIAELLANKTVRKVIAVPKRMVNIVAN
ncbi:MAG: class I tRNA ligase family protein [Planctomycetota bacterium]